MAGKCTFQRAQVGPKRNYAWQVIMNLCRMGLYLRYYGIMNDATYGLAPEMVCYEAGIVSNLPSSMVGEALCLFHDHLWNSKAGQMGS